MFQLEEATEQDLKRLLELFPVAVLKSKWPSISGTKEEICFAVAGQRDFKEIKDFLVTNFSCCRQHVYVFSHSIPLISLSSINIPDGVNIFESKQDKSLSLAYITKLTFSVVLKDPLEEATLEFLWPVRLDFTERHLIVRFVILEKNIGSYFDGRQYYMDRRSTEEKVILQNLEETIVGIQSTDLHKGVKKLWEEGFMDSPKARFKKPISTAYESMDEELGIKEHNPEVYEVLSDSILLNTLFVIPSTQNLSISTFSMEPSKGCINFPRYSEKVGDTDYVVNEILRHN